MSAELVDGVIASVGRHDEALARWRRVAADGLAAGEGEERITQARRCSTSPGRCSEA